MATIFYSDLPLTFKVNPITGDVPPAKNETAVKKSLINLLKTPTGGRPFAPEYGTRIADFLFEPGDTETELKLNDEIAQAIERFEPRVRLVAIETNIEESGVEIKIEYYIINIPDLQQLETVVTRTA